MEEKKVSGEPQIGKNPDGEEFKVTDRRRISLDGERQASGEGDAEEPRLKPVYVEELEARTKPQNEGSGDSIKVRAAEVAASARDGRNSSEVNKAADERARRERWTLSVPCCLWRII